MRNINSQSGYSLVEVLVAITILLLSVAGPLTIANKGLQTSYFARDQLTANMLAQEGIEAIVNLRNEGTVDTLTTTPVDLTTAWDWFDSPAGNFAHCKTAEGCGLDWRDETITNNIVRCNPVSACDLYLDTAGDPRARFVLNGSNRSIYNRVIKVTEVTPGREVNIESTVTWNSPVFGGGQQSVTLSTTLFNVYGL